MIGFSRTATRRRTGRALQLRAVTRIADACFASWQLSGGSVITVSLTLAEYLALRVPGNVTPVNTTGDPLATWLTAWSEPRYSTGVIVAGDVADWSGGDGVTTLNGPHLPAMVFGEAANRQTGAVLATDVTGTTANPGSITVNVPMRSGRSVVNGTVFLPPG